MKFRYWSKTWQNTSHFEIQLLTEVLWYCCSDDKRQYSLQNTCTTYPTCESLGTSAGGKPWWYWHNSSILKNQNLKYLKLCAITTCSNLLYSQKSQITCFAILWQTWFNILKQSNGKKCKLLIKDADLLTFVLMASHSNSIWCVLQN